MKQEIRKAIPKHKTATSDKAWDGPANEANLKLDQTLDYYKKAYAWRDPEGDETKKSSYKFIHHEVSSDSTPGAANIRGCQTGIGILNGARGGANIPDEDKQGVWNHLASHLKDAEVEPAPLRSFNEKVERRSFPVTELRVSKKGEISKIKGHAAVFNKLSEDLGGFREQITPGAFARTIKHSDIRALFNHDPNYILGRNKSGTLTLAEDNEGLAIEIDPPDTSFARDLMVSIDRGDITQMSFAFQVHGEKGEEWDASDPKKVIRTLKEVDLFDVSPVTYPAYPQTDVKVRSVLAAAGIDYDALVDALESAECNTLTDEQTAVLSAAVEKIRGYLPAKAEEPGERGSQELTGAVERLGILRRRLELVADS